MSAPKRQRLTGSFSPASPPYHLAKGAPDITKPLFQPNTPTSPPQNMNPSAASIQQPPVPSSGAATTQPTETARPTPALVANNTTNDTASDAMEIDEEKEDEAQMEEDDGNHTHSPTNHDRQEATTAACDVPKTTINEQMGEGHESVQSHEPMYPLYSHLPEPRPRDAMHGSHDWIKDFGLGPLADRMRRFDEQGNKIPENKLRSSYAGKMKELKIAGKNKSSVTPKDLTGLLEMNEAQWAATPAGRWDLKTPGTMEAMLNSDAFKAKLNKAFKLDDTPLPKEIDAQYRPILGNDELLAAPKTAGTDFSARPSAGGASNLSGKKPDGFAQRNSRVGTPGFSKDGPGRPMRTNTKRKYTDNSFTGYGEGFLDDEMGDESVGEDGVGGSKNKKRKTASALAGYRNDRDSIDEIGVEVQKTAAEEMQKVFDELRVSHSIISIYLPPSKMRKIETMIRIFDDLRAFHRHGKN
ncbi:hypothetical protein K402DRAFT_461264 [Aulographum hederae CBS 113979]|uniref:Mediator of RNA polymerase II transcription subunit 19 n=1 Tax=Aulographum hederae CBS 113979 TaxID=1176131 RepID=A0A6G1H8N1_9PEZI|nr:hypothetical protein K402DRAFT_461264 [Aulographum hederae CBS 113979]